MLIIKGKIYTGNPGGEYKEYLWQLGESIPYINIDDVQYVQADGNELSKIEYMYLELTARGVNVQDRWGDLARTILSQLFRKFEEERKLGYEYPSQPKHA
jgi:hypothetical protein